MSLINFEINLPIKWFAKCFSVADTVANKVATFTISDTNIYVLVIALSTHDNVKLKT